MAYMKDSKGRRLDSFEVATEKPIAAQRVYRAARGSADLAACSIFAMGDSILDGQGSLLSKNRWIERFLAAERSKYQPKGIAGARGFRPPYWTSPLLQASDPPAAIVGGTPATIGFGPGLGGRGVLLTAGVTVTYTVPSATSVDVVFQRLTAGSPIRSGGTMKVTIDGVDQATVDTSGARLENATQRYTFGARGAHTVAITSTAGGVLFEGIVEYDQDEVGGIRVFEAGAYSRTTVQYAANLYPNGALRDQIIAARPSLVINALNTNDFLTQTVPSAAAAARLNLVTAVKAAAGLGGFPVPSIVHVLMRCSTAPTVPQVYSFDAYLTEFQKECAADPLVQSVLDERMFFPTVEQDGSLFSDGLHHNPRGNALDANIISQFLA
jgi:hypothetical protein